MTLVNLESKIGEYSPMTPLVALLWLYNWSQLWLYVIYLDSIMVIGYIFGYNRDIIER